MAATKKPAQAQAAEETSGSNGAADDEAPAGFEKVFTGHEGWVSFKKGKAISGQIVGYQERHDQDGYEFLLKLIKPCAGKASGGDEVVHQPGTIVAMNETAQMGELRYFVGSKARIWVKPEDKRPAKKGSVWVLDIRIDPAAKRGQLPEILRANAPPPPEADPSADGADEIPF